MQDTWQERTGEVYLTLHPTTFPQFSYNFLNVFRVFYRHVGNLESVTFNHLPFTKEQSL